MRRVPYTELKIVGFNEAVKDVPCARVSPIVQHIPTNDYFLLLKGDADEAEVSAWWTRAELESLVVENRATLLSESDAIPAFSSAMMLYVANNLLAATGWELPTSLNGENLHQWVPARDGETLVVCASSKTIDALMDDWAQQLMGKTTHLMVKFFAHKDKGLHQEAEQLRAEAERLARMARSAAVSRKLRAEVLLHLGSSIIHSETPERWNNLRPMVLRTFPRWKWETLLEQLNLFVKSLRAKASQDAGEVIGNNATDDIHKEIIKNVISIVEIADEQQRRRSAQLYTRVHRELHPVDETILSRVEEKLIQQGARDNPWIYLEDRELVVALAGEEALYNPDVFKVLPTRRPAVNLVGFLRIIKKEGPLLSGADDLIDASSLAGKLKIGVDRLSAYICSQLSHATNKLLDQYQPPQQPSQELKESLVDEFNALISGTSLYADICSAGIQLTKGTQELIRQKLQGTQLLRLNRMLLEEAYPQEIAKNRSPIADRVQMAATGRAEDRMQVAAAAGR